MAAAQWDPECKVYVGGFDGSVTQEQIVALCAKYGKVVDHGALSRRRTGMIVLFDSAASANAAVAALSGSEFEGTTIESNIAKARSVADVPPSTHVYLAGFPLDAEDVESTARALAEPFGTVVDLDRIVRTQRDGPGPTSQAFFVTYDSIDSAVAAIAGLNGKVVGGATLVCEPRRRLPRKAHVAAPAAGDEAPAVGGGAKKARKKRPAMTAARAAAKATGPFVVIKGLAAEVEREDIVAAVPGAVRVLWSKRNSANPRRRGAAEAAPAGQTRRKTVFLELADAAAQASALALSGSELCGDTVTIEEKSAEAAPAERQPRKKRIAVDVLTEAFIKAGLPDGATEAVIKGGAKGSVSAEPRKSLADKTVSVVTFGSEAAAAAFVARNGEDIFGAGPCELKFNRSWQDEE